VHAPAGHLDPTVRSRRGGGFKLLKRLINSARALLRGGIDKLRHLSGKVDRGLRRLDLTARIELYADDVMLTWSYRLWRWFGNCHTVEIGSVSQRLAQECD